MILVTVATDILIDIAVFFFINTPSRTCLLWVSVKVSQVVLKTHKKESLLPDLLYLTNVYTWHLTRYGPALLQCVCLCYFTVSFVSGVILSTTCIARFLTLPIMDWNDLQTVATTMIINRC